ncbi:hypothetical protein ACFYYD_29315 [Streptomyces bluensis]|uniref:hypothetical protein n=1 Tax=Streptomyces bluensis TaxID=33897 RepID=UPI0036C9ED4B
MTADRTPRPGVTGDSIRARLLDRALTTAITRAGAPGRIRFTERQLYYEMCRVLRPVHTVPRRVPLTPAPPVRYERFEETLRRRDGEIPGLLAPLPASASMPYRPGEPDLYDYGLPRLLVCQSRSVARMLLANDLHLEAACPVFAADDAPLDPRLVAGLGRVDGATVHVLHDASTAGIALTAQVRAEVPGIRVASMGLVPRHATALHLISQRGPAPTPLPATAPGPAGAPSGLEPREREWLAGGRTAEVESVPPARLLRTVLRMVRGPRTSGHSVWTGLRELRTAGFMTWPSN